MKLASRTSLWRQQVVDVLVVDLELETKQQQNSEGAFSCV